jgi:hypothetical protein
MRLQVSGLLGLHLPLLVVATVAPAPNPAPWPAGWCPCADQQLCKPLSPQPPKNRTEVIAYPGISSAYGQTRSDWRQYDWSKVTAIALYVDLGNAAQGCHTFEHPGSTPCGGWPGGGFPDFCCLDPGRKRFRGFRGLT